MNPVPRYSRVSGRFWTDEKSSRWNDRIKLAALYILTCPHRSTEGIFKLPPQYACADLQWSMKSWNSALTFLQEEGFLKWDSRTNVVLIVNALRYQAPENPNQSESAIRRIKDLPETPLLKEFCALAIDHCYRKGATPAAQAFAQLLNQQLLERLGQQSAPLNLSSLSPSKTQTQSQTLKNVTGTENDEEFEGVVYRGRKVREEDLPIHLRAVEGPRSSFLSGRG